MESLLEQIGIKVRTPIWRYRSAKFILAARWSVEHGFVAPFARVTELLDCGQ